MFMRRFVISVVCSLAPIYYAFPCLRVDLLMGNGAFFLRYRAHLFSKYGHTFRPVSVSGWVTSIWFYMVLDDMGRRSLLFAVCASMRFAHLPYFAQFYRTIVLLRGNVLLVAFLVFAWN